MSQTLRTCLWLSAILALETVVYAPSLKMFYCGDSLYWFSQIPESWHAIVEKFQTPDERSMYRPLASIFFAYVVYPVAGLDLFRNHLFPLLLHGLNTVLVYLLSFRFFRERWKGLLSAFFFGISSTGVYITYDNTFIPDYLYVFFYLSALLMLCRSLEKSSLVHSLMALVLFLLALFSKEAAVTFPVAAFVVLTLQNKTSETAGNISWRKILLVCLAFAFVVLAYIGWHLVMKGGTLYPADPNQPYHLEPSWANVRSRLPVFCESLGLPADVLRQKPDWRTVLALSSMGPLLIWMFGSASWGLFHMRPVYWCGIFWSLATIAPALFVAAKPWEHNLYLPLVGVSWIFAESLSEARKVLVSTLSKPLFVPLLLAYVLVTLTWATIANGSVIRRSSWMASGSIIAENCLADLKRLNPPIGPNTVLYIEPARQEIHWYFDSGRLLATLYNDRSIQMLFLDDGHPVPTERMLRSGRVYLLKYVGGHLYDMTQRRRLEMLDRWSYRILEHWEKGMAEYQGKRYSLENEWQRSPDDRLVFPAELGLSNGARDTLVTVPGVTYSHPLPEISPQSQLRFGVALESQRGDGLLAEVRLKGPEGERTLYARDLTTSIPPSQHAWEDQSINLAAVEGPGYVLKLLAQPLPGRTNTENWLEWSQIEIVPPAAQKIIVPPVAPPDQPTAIRILPSPSKKGEWVTVEVIGGEDMVVDCQYTLDPSHPPKTLLKWLTTDTQGCRRLQVNTPGHYVFTAIRNALRADWVPIHYEWDCLP